MKFSVDFSFDRDMEIAIGRYLAAEKELRSAVREIQRIGGLIFHDIEANEKPATSGN